MVPDTTGSVEPPVPNQGAHEVVPEEYTRLGVSRPRACMARTMLFSSS
jgi:hypothetical protein